MSTTKPMPTHLRVTAPNLPKRCVYLTRAHVIRKSTITFLVVDEVKRNGDEVMVRTEEGLAEVRHMIQLGDGVRAVPYLMNLTYADVLERMPKEKAQRFWSYPEVPDGTAR